MSNIISHLKQLLVGEISILIEFIYKFIGLSFNTDQDYKLKMVVNSHYKFTLQLYLSRKNASLRTLFQRTRMGTQWIHCWFYQWRHGGACRQLCNRQTGLFQESPSWFLRTFDHRTGPLDQGDVTVVMDVLHFLPVPGEGSSFRALIMAAAEGTADIVACLF